MKEGAAIRFLLVALPTGLLLLGVGAMVATHLGRENRPADPNEAKRLDAASLQRRPVSRGDLAASVGMLANRIGERHPGRPEGLERAAFWIESTLGPGNLGYVVERHGFEVGEQELRNLVAELPGRKRRREIVVVGAHYDSDPDDPSDGGAVANAAGTASLLALARAFAGDPQERTIRFVAFAAGRGPTRGTDATGSFVYARRCRAREEDVVAMLGIEWAAPVPAAKGAGTASAGGEGIFLVGDGGSRYFLDSARGAFRAAVTLNVETVMADGDADRTEGPVFFSDAGAFREAGFPAVLAANAVAEAGGKIAPGGDAEKGEDFGIDFGALEEATLGLEAIVRAWANPSGGQ